MVRVGHVMLHPFVKNFWKKNSCFNFRSFVLLERWIISVRIKPRHRKKKWQKFETMLDWLVGVITKYFYRNAPSPNKQKENQHLSIIHISILISMSGKSIYCLINCERNHNDPLLLLRVLYSKLSLSFPSSVLIPKLLKYFWIFRSFSEY